MSTETYIVAAEDVLGVTLVGRKLPDGAIRMATGAIVAEWPGTVMRDGVLYDLRCVAAVVPLREGEPLLEQAQYGPELGPA